MNSNAALLYLTKLKLKNLVIRAIKKPLKLVGFVLIMAYFIIMPFTLASFVRDFGLNNPLGFVLIVTVGNIWITLPSLLTYLKRKGIAFDKSDVNLMFSTPIKSKNILVYSIYKQAYISIVFTLVMSVAGVFIFEISPLKMVMFFVMDLLVYNTLLNMTGVVMYGSYNISDQLKKIIRYVSYAIMLGVLIALVITMFVEKSFSVAGLMLVLGNPILYLLPVIGQGIAGLNLVVLGPNVYNVIGTLALVIEVMVIIRMVSKIPNDGEYYEDALTFAEDISRKVEQAGKGGNILMIKKRHKKANEKGSQDFVHNGARVIFDRQILELKRSSRFIFSVRDMFMILTSIIGGVCLIYFDVAISADEYVMIGLGFIIYVCAFFTRKPLWFEEFNNLIYYAIPEKAQIKLFYANLLDYVMAFARNVLIVLPISLGAKQSLINIIAMIIAVSMIEIMVSTSKMIFEKYLSIKINAVFASFVTLILNGLLLLPLVGIILVLSAFDLNLLGTLLVTIYCVILTFLFLLWASKVFDTAESFEA